jgi:hypothetical protein
MKKTLALLLATLAPAIAQAAEIPMAPVECTNLILPECSAVEAVFAEAYASASGVRVARAPGGPVLTGGGAPGEGAHATVPVPATEHIRVSAVRLTSRIALRASLNRADGTPIHAVDMTATTLDDIQPVADRMARALVNRTTVSETMNLKNITRTEGARPNRTFTEKVMGMKSGITVPFASGVDLAPMLSFQFDGRFEADWYFLEFGAGLTIPSNKEDTRGYGGLFSEFGGSVYIGHESPLYVGAGVIPRLFFSSDDGGVQAALYGQVGLMFMRSSSTRLYTELRVGQNVLPVRFVTTQPTPPNYISEAKNKYPTEFSLQIGIGW